MKKFSKKDKKNEKKFSDKTLSNQQNLIEDIKYRTTNTNGDIYEIIADFRG